MKKMTKYKNNKYTKWYYDIIDNARNRTLESNIYVEKHHILPLSLGGTNDFINIVKLTAREHFLVHMLLVKMTYAKDKYKMIAALVRFGHKINSKQYELLRLYASKYSKGKYNHAYGKIWVHNTKTKEILFIEKEEYDASSHTKGLPYQLGGHKNTMWINNGTEQTMIPRNSTIPPSWKKGRLFGFGNKEQLINASKKRHTKEKDLAHSEKMKNRIQIVKNGKAKKISIDELDEFEKKGWTRGFFETSSSRKCSIDNVEYITLGEAAYNLNISTSKLCYRLKSTSLKWINWKYI